MVLKFKFLVLIPCLLAGIVTFGQPVSGQPDINTAGYGGPFSIGVSIGGGGLVNLPIRAFLKENIALEFSPGLRPVVSDNFENFYMNIALIGGLTINFNKEYIASKDRVRMNGLFIKGGGSLGSHYNELIFGAGWSYERFKAIFPTRSFNLELGIGLIRLHDLDTFEFEGFYIEGGEDYTYTPAIFWRVAWHFFFPKKSAKQ